MCELNPRFKHKYVVEIFAAFGTKKDFDDWVESIGAELLHLELKCNSCGGIRVHVHNLEEQNETHSRTKETKES